MKKSSIINMLNEADNWRKELEKRTKDPRDEEIKDLKARLDIVKESSTKVLKMVDMSMPDTLVSFETAKLAKNKGFNIAVFNLYEYLNNTPNKIKIANGGRLTKNSDWDINNEQTFQNVITAPTQEILKKWLREVHNLYVESNPNASGYGWFIDKTNGTHIKCCEFEGPNDGGRWDKYEDALEVGLQEALKLIK